MCRFYVKKVLGVVSCSRLQSVHETTTWTTSVCTGSLLLAAAGLLADAPATTHWRARETLASLGAVPVPDRVVRHGKIITAAGVSSGIDMALRLLQELYGDETAQAVQLGIEYDPDPPLDAGSPDKAPTPIVEVVTAVFDSPEAEALEAGTAPGSYSRPQERERPRRRRPPLPRRTSSEP
jgi:hypothetical protein